MTFNQLSKPHLKAKSAAVESFQFERIHCASYTVVEPSHLGEKRAGLGLILVNVNQATSDDKQVSQDLDVCCCFSGKKLSSWSQIRPLHIITHFSKKLFLKKTFSRFF